MLQEIHIRCDLDYIYLDQMNAQVLSKYKFIGSVTLQIGDESMGCLYGDLTPNKNYYRNVQEVVWLFNSGSGDYLDVLTDLKINVRLENGYFLFAEGGITFDDVKELDGEPIRIDITGVDRQVIQDYFLETGPLTFVEEPWYVLTIKEKMELESWFLKELGNSDGKFDKLFTTPNNKAMTDLGLSALSYYGSKTSKLFIIQEKGFERKFVVVNQMYESIQDGLPEIEVFQDFHHFKYFRMYPDKADWFD